MDCHVGQDVHGDGRIYTAHDYQVGIECEDCHGSVTERATPDAGGVFRTTAGDALKRLSLADDGSLVLRGALDNQDHPVTQLVDLDPSSNPNLAAAHGPDDGGANHTASMECYACHTAWTQSCLGCHVTVDTRYTGRNLIDGSVTAGRVGGTRSWVVTDYLALGVGVDGKLTPMAPQEKMFVTVVVPCDPAIETCDVPADGDLAGPGRKLWDQQVRHTQDGKLGMGFGPVAPHTTSRGSQACDRCHLREDGTNASIVDETLGRASGRFVIPDGDGVDYDLTQVVDAEGNAIVGMAHEGTAVLPADVVQRMLIPRVPNSGLTLREVPPWTPPD